MDFDIESSELSISSGGIFEGNDYNLIEEESPSTSQSVIEVMPLDSIPLDSSNDSSVQGGFSDNSLTPSMSQSVSNPTAFQVIGTKVYDPNGQEFIAKGVNVFTWDGTKNIDNYMDTWGFNTVRVPNYLLGSWNQPHPADDGYATNRAIADAYTQRGAVVIFDAHDLIGSYYEGENFEVLKDHWRTMAQEFKDNPYVWFNLHNEPGNKTAQPEKWVSYHRELIDIIRAEGAQNNIVIDGETWGQDYKTRTILNKAAEVMEGNENIMFSLHIYRQWGDGHEVGDYIDQLHAENIPVMIGEYGNTPATEQMMLAAQEREVGRVAWVAMAADPHDLTTGTKGHAWHYDGSNPEILTDLGELILDDLERSENLEQLAAPVQNFADPSLGASNFATFASVSSMERNANFVDETSLSTQQTISNEVKVRQSRAQSFLLGSSDSFSQISLESGLTKIKGNQSITVLDDTDNQILGWDTGNDVIKGKGGNDALSGLGGNDYLLGGTGDDQLFGDNGNDTLIGGGGDDLVAGGLGDDLLKGGGGRDLFWLDMDSGIDTILDFNTNKDRLVLGKGLEIDLLDFVQGSGEHAGDTVIQSSVDDQILVILSNTDASTISQEHILLF